MKAAAITSKPQSAKSVRHAFTFTKVLDGRKQPIRGLWKRGARFYARLNVADPQTGAVKTRRIPLVDAERNPVETVAQAMAELRRLQTQRIENALPVMGQTPKFSDYVETYLARISAGRGEKKRGSIEKDRSILERWKKAIGSLRLDQIKLVHVKKFRTSRLEEKLSPRTVNLDIIAFRVVMRHALEDGYIQRLPTAGLKPLKTVTPKRSLFAAADIDAVRAAAFEKKKNKSGTEIPVTENAQQFSDYIALMSYSGVRRNEALGLQWTDVDFDNAQLFVRRQLTAKGIEDLKNSEQRVVDFNPKLRAHLLDMKERRPPDLLWLFPSPQRGSKDVPAKTFRESLELSRAQANLPNFQFHDCRHHFISMCVMSGIDFMTIAAWVGHKDGGVLIGKVYGHLANEHRKAMAERVSFNPVILEAAS